jgi:hypothetical protein
MFYSRNLQCPNRRAETGIILKHTGVRSLSRTRRCAQQARVLPESGGAGRKPRAWDLGGHCRGRQYISRPIAVAGPGRAGWVSSAWLPRQRLTPQREGSALQVEVPGELSGGGARSPCPPCWPPRWRLRSPVAAVTREPNTWGSTVWARPSAR